MSGLQNIPNLKVVALFLLLTGSVLMGNIAERIEPQVQLEVGMGHKEQDRLEKVASASLLGQFRSNMADFLWLKVDKYVHNGVDLRGATPLEREQMRFSKVKTSAEEKAGNRSHSETDPETTVVPAKQYDWRGIFGDLERNTQPYQNMDGHHHRDPKEALPLFRLMTISNPHFVRGYVTGASMISFADTPKAYDEAIKFLEEGERNNPESIEIATSLGMMYTSKKRDFEPGVPYLRQAIAIAAARDKTTLSEDEVDAYEDAYRWLVLNRREAHKPEEAMAAAVAGLRVFPLDVTCNRYINTHKR